MKNRNQIMLTLLLAVGIGACSSSPKVKEFADTSNPANEVQLLANDLKTATDNQVDALSPDAFKDADEAYKSALNDQKKGKDGKDVLHQVAVGRAHLDRANKFAELSRTNMESVVAARQAALTAGAPASLPKEFAKADSHLRDVTSEIENNDLSSVKDNKDKLQSEYLAIELKAIQASNLNAARATVALAEKEGAEEYAQQSLAIAHKQISDTDAFIVANRHETDQVTARSKSATVAADHLLKITRASKSGKNVSSEETALRLESEQNKTKMGQIALDAERSNSQDLVAETAELRSAHTFNQRFEAARAKFSPKEAEVSRQGDKLVIRLRALEFPVNQSVLRASNFPLLAKVVGVVKGFENASVVVEGHTDSDGGAALNKKLSEERAHAISEYLISNNAISSKQVSDAGYGYERPLATNKTAVGKAQNRRVDIIITPEVVSD